MSINFKNIFSLVVLAFFLVACSSKDEQEYNKPAIYWYNKMLTQITNYSLEEADDTYISLESEHRNSPLIPPALMILANAHIDEEEYQLANYYLDEYVKRFALEKDIDYVRYLKIKANFLAFKNQFREQELISDTINETNEFIVKFPDSTYIFLVKDIQSRLYMAQSVFDKEIAELYARVDKPLASEYYMGKAEQNSIKVEDIQDVNVPWYRWIFE